MESEANILKRIMLRLSKATAGRIFRNNVGTGWQGSTSAKTAGKITLLHPRPLRAGLCTGSSDLIGWQPYKVKPEDVGRTIAVFTAIEVKSQKGTARPEQKRFIEILRQAGGIAGIARSEKEAEEMIANYKPI